MLKPPPSKEPFNFTVQFEGVLANNKLSNRACKRDIVKKREREPKSPHNLIDLLPKSSSSLDSDKSVQKWFGSTRYRSTTHSLNSLHNNQKRVIVPKWVKSRTFYRFAIESVSWAKTDVLAAAERYNMWIDNPSGRTWPRVFIRVVAVVSRNPSE